LLQVQLQPREYLASGTPDAGTVRFVSYAVIENELTAYTAFSGGIALLRLSNGHVLRYVKTNATPLFALPVTYLHSGARFLSTDIVIKVRSSLLRISSANGSVVWTTDLYSAVISDAVVGDVDGDRCWDVPIGDYSGGVYLVRGSDGLMVWIRKESTAPILDYTRTIGRLLKL